MKSKAPKWKHSATNTYSSSDKNTNREDEGPLSPLQEAQCSATLNVILHISDDLCIELIRESIIIVTVYEDELEGMGIVPPLSLLNIMMLNMLIARLVKPKGIPVEEANNQPPPKDMEVDQKQPSKGGGAPAE